MAAIHHDLQTLRVNGERRFHQAEQDLKKHQRTKGIEIALLWIAAAGACAAGLFALHLLR